jgi:hypothetical protein
MDRRRRRWAVALAAAGVLCVIGLIAALLIPLNERRQAEQRLARFIPSSELAREALVSALEGWKKGSPPRKLPSGQTIVVADTHRKPGQSLVSYRIVGEAPLHDGRRFIVRARLADPEQEERIQFLVIGVDPLYVFRQEDYDMIAHWEHLMTNESTATEASAGIEPPAPEK